ncbi:MAG: dihydroxy-acid dehydratase, partial [Thiofilum sp.]
ANGMPELHGLTPILGLVQERGYQVALVTDGRMSGASGKVPAAIHVSPEALDRGMIACIQDGDIIRLDATAGTLEVLGVDLSTRTPATLPHSNHHSGIGRELFGVFRSTVSPASQGASVLFTEN